MPERGKDMANAIHLSAADARINVALDSVRGAMTGHVAIHASPDRAGDTAPLYGHLEVALDALTRARSEVNRLIGNLS